MNTQINDEAFGELNFEDPWIRKINIQFLGASKEIDLWVEGNDENEAIWQEQRDAYKYYLGK